MSTPSRMTVLETHTSGRHAQPGGQSDSIPGQRDTNERIAMTDLLVVLAVAVTGAIGYLIAGATGAAWEARIPDVPPGSLLPR